MKIILTLTAILMLSVASHAQWSFRFLENGNHFLYSSGEYLIGNHNGGKLSLNYMYKSKFIVNFGYSATTKEEAELPDHILKSTTQLVAANPTPAFTNSENFHLMVGRVFNVNRAKTMRLIIQGGPGIQTNRDPVYTINANTYDYKNERTTNFCAVVNPKIEIPLGEMLGVSTGPFAVVDQDSKFFGASIGIMYGIVKNKTRYH